MRSYALEKKIALFYVSFSGEGIKELVLLRCGKLKSTNPSKLRQPQIVDCICRNPRAAAIHQNISDLVDYGSCQIYMAAMHEMPQSMRWNVVQLVDCGSWIAAAINLKVELPQSRSRNPWATSRGNVVCRVLRLGHCGGTPIGVEAAQYKPFYMVPIILPKKVREVSGIRTKFLIDFDLKYSFGPISWATKLLLRKYIILSD